MLGVSGPGIRAAEWGSIEKDSALVALALISRSFRVLELRSTAAPGAVVPDSVANGLNEPAGDAAGDAAGGAAGGAAADALLIPAVMPLGTLRASGCVSP